MIDLVKKEKELFVRTEYRTSDVSLYLHNPFLIW